MEEYILEKLVKKNKSTRQIANELNKSQTNIRYWLKKYNLSTNFTNFYLEFNCKFCGEKEENKMMNKGGGRRAKTICKLCHNKNTIKRQQKNKQQAVDYKGGKCKICSYDRCLSALEFHHRDPKNKEINWIYMRSWGINKIYKELDKCDLVCANCHREIHANMGTW